MFRLETATHELAVEFAPNPLVAEPDCDPLSYRYRRSSLWIVCEGIDDDQVRLRRVGLDGVLTPVDLPVPDDVDLHWAISEDGSTAVSQQPKSVIAWRAGQILSVPVVARPGTKLSPDGRFLLHPAPNRIEKWSFKSSGLAASWPITATLVSMSPDEKLLLVELAGGLAILDDKGERVAQYAAYRESFADPVWSADSSTVVVETGDSTAVLYSRDSGFKRLNIRDPDVAGRYHLSDDGSVVVVEHGSSFYIWLPDANVTWHASVPGAEAIAVEPNALRLYSSDGMARLELPRLKHAALDELTNARIDASGQLVRTGLAAE